MNYLKYFVDFEKKYHNTTFSNDWYKTELGVYAELSKSEKAISKNGDFSEEFYRARLVYSLVKSKAYPAEHIFVEYKIPKGNNGKSIKPDIVIFQEDWYNDYQLAKQTKDYSHLREKYLLFFEAKKNSKTIQSAIENQLRSAMSESTSDLPIYGVYFDNKNELLIFKKTGKNEIYRYYQDKRPLKGSTGLNSWNLSLRDQLSQLPSYEELIKASETYSNLSNQFVMHMEPMDQKAFGEVVQSLIKEADKIHPDGNVKELIVEFLTIKIFDEKRSIELNRHVDFYIENDEIEINGLGKLTFRKRIAELYNSAKLEYRKLLSTSRQVFNYDDKYRPDSNSDEKFLIAVIKQLQQYSILNAPNDAFNQIIFNNFGQEADKASKSQFFTPIPVVNCLVEMINPRVGETVVAPAAGIADFLAMTYKYTHPNKTSSPATNIFAFDIDKDNLKLAELNLVLNGDGGAQIHQLNSLSQKLTVSGVPTTEGEFTTVEFNKDDWSSKISQTRDVLSYDIVLTNPPFGKGRDLSTGDKGIWDLPIETLKLYDTFINKLDIDDSLPKTMDMGALFLENSVKLLKEGGRMAIILSNSLATIEEWINVRKWFLSKMRLVATLDLPSNSFGETGVATTVIIAYKPKREEQDMLDKDYSVYMANVNNLGYQVKTVNRVITFVPTFKRDFKTFETLDEIDEDFTDIISDFRDYLLSQEPSIKQAFLGE